MLLNPRIPAATKCFGVLRIDLDHVIVVVNGALTVSAFLAEESALPVGNESHQALLHEWLALDFVCFLIASLGA